MSIWKNFLYWAKICLFSPPNHIPKIINYQPEKAIDFTQFRFLVFQTRNEGSGRCRELLAEAQLVSDRALKYAICCALTSLPGFPADLAQPNQLCFTSGIQFHLLSSSSKNNFLKMSAYLFTLNQKCKLGYSRRSTGLGVRKPEYCIYHSLI